MPRKKQIRKVEGLPKVIEFKPVNCRGKAQLSVNLFYEEYEAIRLMDYLNCNQEEAAEKMGISRPTFTRLYESARRKLSVMLIEGKALKIDGGSYRYDKDWHKCNDCNEYFEKQEKDAGCTHCESENTKSLNPKESFIDLKTQYCICLSCGERALHQKGIPCRTQKCKNCGAFMARETLNDSNSHSSDTN